MATESTGAPADLKARLAASYNSIAPEYNEWTVQQSGFRLEYLRKVLSSLLPTSPGVPIRVLELGCGSGIPVTKALLDESPTIEVMANDMSSAQIDIGRQKLGNKRVTWLECDMMEINADDQSLDLVVGMYSLIHLPREQQSDMLRKIWMWLKPGGLILLNFATEESKGHVMEKWMGDGGWMYWSSWGKEKTLEKVKEVGFKVLTAEITEDAVDAEFLWVIAEK